MLFFNGGLIRKSYGKLYSFIKLIYLNYFAFQTESFYESENEKVMSAQNVSNLFYHFVSLPSFLCFLFTFNTAYAVSRHKAMFLL